MRATRKTPLFVILGAGFVVVLSLLAFWLSGGGSTHAQGPVILAIDMDPTGNSCPGDGETDCTVGTIDACVSVPALPGTTFQIDAVVKSLWNGHNGWTWDLSFPDTNTPALLTLTGEVVQNQAINLIVQSPGSSPNIISGGVPDALSPHTAAMEEFGTAETTPPWTQGVLSRMTLQLGAGAVPGMYQFSFSPGTYHVVDGFGTDYPQVTVLDGSMGCGYVAIGTTCPWGPCPMPTPTPTPDPPAGGIAELPDVAGSSGPPYAALAIGLSAVAVALTAGAWYARRRQPR